MNVEYFIILKRKDNNDLLRIKIEAKSKSVCDFHTAIQDNIESGNIPNDSDIVSISNVKFDVVHKIDWSIAPKGTKAWAKNEDGKCHWFIGGSASTFNTCEGGKWLCQSWVIQEAAPDFGLQCLWSESICHMPVEIEIENMIAKKNIKRVIET